MNQIKWYYSNFNVQYYFLHYLKNREFAFFPSKVENVNAMCRKRNLNIRNIQGFQFWVKRLRLLEENNWVNFYYSLAQFKDIPFTDPQSLKLEEDKNEWNKEAWENIIAYDMLIDIDAGINEEFSYALLSAELLKRLFDLNNLPFHLRFSGNGFHFIIPYKYFAHLNLSFNPNDEKNIYRYMSKIGEYLHDNVSELIDLSVYDSRRVAKIPYSLSLYPDKTFICQPIHDLEKFDLKDMTLTKGLNLRSDKIFNPEGNIKMFEDIAK